MLHETLPNGDARAADHHPLPNSETTYGLVARSLSEALGSFLLILAGLGVSILNPQGGMAPGLAFGIALIAAIIAFGHVSGGHFNPAITLGSAIAGRTRWISVLPYVVAQVIGGLAAAGLFWLIFSSHPQQLQTTQLFSNVANGFGDHSALQFPLSSAFLMEVTAAALLTAVVLGATGRLVNRAVAPFAIGLAYAALLTLLLPITNGSINPARSTAAAVFSEGWALEQLWLFWAAPLLGALIAGLTFRSVEFAGRGTDGKTEADDETVAVHDVDGAPAQASAGSPAPARIAPIAPGVAEATAQRPAAARQDDDLSRGDARDFFDSGAGAGHNSEGDAGTDNRPPKQG